METPPDDPVEFPMTPEEFGTMGNVMEEIAERGALMKRLPTRPYERARILQAFDEAFELIGGVPRLAVWAHKNPGKFFPLYLRTAGAQIEVQHSGEVIIRPAIPRSPLDGEYTDIPSAPLPVTEQQDD